MLEADRIRSGKLKRYVKRGDPRGIHPEWRNKVRKILWLLHIATSPSQLDMPGFNFHELKYDRKGTFAVTVQGNWRITFKWDDRGPYDVDLEDYHGK